MALNRPGNKATPEAAHFSLKMTVLDELYCAPSSLDALRTAIYIYMYV